MYCFYREASCVKHLRELLKSKFPKNKIETFKNIEKTFFAKWQPFLNDFPFKTHEIDIVRGYRNKNGETHLEAIEVKYFKYAKRGRRYTEGFGQALGLLLWGFDFVTVYHVFDQKFDEIERKRFVKTAVELSASLKLITYRAFLVKNEKGIQMYQLKNSGDVTENSPNIQPGSNKNPLLRLKINNLVRKRREFIETEVLGFVP